MAFDLITANILNTKNLRGILYLGVQKMKHSERLRYA